VPAGVEVTDGDQLPAEVPVDAPILTGFDVRGGRPVEDAAGVTAVELRFTPHGATAFGAWTAANVGERLAIVIDGRVVSAPIVQAPIPDGSVLITGIDPAASAALLADLRELGIPAVPDAEVALEVVRERDPDWSSLPDHADLEREAAASFDLAPLVAGDWIRATPSPLTLTGDLWRRSGATDPAGAWLVDVMQVGACDPVDDGPAVFADPCAWRHAWTFRVSADGTVGLLFDEGSPLADRP
jgi:hypothetical protein